MSKSQSPIQAPAAALAKGGTSGAAVPTARVSRSRIALLSNPKSSGNIAQLSRIRDYCADHPGIFHYEVDRADQIGEALRTIAQIRPKMLVINGGDGTVQVALTEIYNGGHFGDLPPPVAVLPNGKTNLIALDLGSQGDPIVALERLVELAEADLAPHLVARELIALRPNPQALPVIGMFLGGAGLADTMLFCRDKVYPLGLPNGISHVLTAVALLFRMLFRVKAGFLPPNPSPLQVSMHRQGRISGRFSLLVVTTLDKLLLSSELSDERSGVARGSLKLLAIEEHPFSLVRAFAASLAGKLGRSKVKGVHFQQADQISIEGDSSPVILDGEMFRTEKGRPILLQQAAPLSFVRLAA
jgi:diacylglycerol kinase family enzyme